MGLAGKLRGNDGALAKIEGASPWPCPVRRDGLFIHLGNYAAGYYGYIWA